MRAQFITAEEVQQILKVSRSKSYQIVRDLNKELKSMGYHTIAGKCPTQFFQQKFYGLEIGGDDN
ncbi:ICEBs1 excisionase [Holdemania massiliensis]|uniref:ICEBs1 excisionase n=1 Tax=Holdemania massiliensis TaxID=1468449 RepID=UPI003569F86B